MMQNMVNVTVFKFGIKNQIELWLSNSEEDFKVIMKNILLLETLAVECIGR